MTSNDCIVFLISIVFNAIIMLWLLFILAFINCKKCLFTKFCSLLKLLSCNYRKLTSYRNKTIFNVYMLLILRLHKKYLN